MTNILLALTVIERLSMAGMAAQAAISRYNAMVSKATAEGRDITQEELDALAQETDAAVAAMPD